MGLRKGPTVKKHHLLIIFAVFTALVVTFLVGGLLTYEEPGLAHPEASWTKTPLSICIEQGKEDLVFTVQSSVNTQLGFDALIVNPKPSDTCDITVRMGVAVEVGQDEAGGRYTLERHGDTYTHCDVETANTGTTELELLVLEHEMGHCLGLMHDDFDASIMRPVQKPRRDGSFPAMFTDWDRELLREKYMR